MNTVENEKIWEYLFELQESGVTNMFGAAPFIQRRFPATNMKQARELLGFWMNNYELLQKQSSN